MRGEEPQVLSKAAAQVEDRGTGACKLEERRVNWKGGDAGEEEDPLADAGVFPVRPSFVALRGCLG